LRDVQIDDGQLAEIDFASATLDARLKARLTPTA
jgi:hypothetical protein